MGMLFINMPYSVHCACATLVPNYERAVIVMIVW